jgi:kynurenine formamidase
MTDAMSSVSLEEFERLFEAVKNWGRWGESDELGTVNYITPATVRAAASLVSSGRRVSLTIPINKVAGPDNPQPAIHLLGRGHDVPINAGKARFAMDFVGIAFHGDCHTHVDALCHISYAGTTYNGRTATEVVNSTGATALDVTAYGAGVVGRGVLLDIAGLRGVKWLEPGEAVTRAELEECAVSEGVEVGEGDIVLLRTGHHRRRLELGPRNNSPPPAGEGKAGLHVDALPWMHERRVAALLPDGNGETVPSVVDGLTHPIHVLAIVAMGLLLSDSHQFEDLAAACEAERRHEFMVVGLPLMLPGGTGSPWNPIAIF